jgi:hypothetical protein
LASDAYATGQALYALRIGGGMSPTHETYRKGVSILLQTQLPDGTWLVHTRSYPFQPYFESGFPHGPDQWISSAATSWATLSLTLALDDPGGTPSRHQQAEANDCLLPSRQLMNAEASKRRPEHHQEESPREHAYILVDRGPELPRKRS